MGPEGFMASGGVAVPPREHQHRHSPQTPRCDSLFPEVGLQWDPAFRSYSVWPHDPSLHILIDLLSEQLKGCADGTVALG